jgi:hypothetical protein
MRAAMLGWRFRDASARRLLPAGADWSPLAAVFADLPVALLEIAS